MLYVTNSRCIVASFTPQKKIKFYPPNVPDKEGWPDTHNLQKASSVSAYKEATKILTDKVWGYLIAKISF